MKKTEELPFKIKTLDVVIGMIVAIAVSDWAIQPHFDNPHASYGSKMVSWLIVTILFVLIAAAVIGCAVYIRSKRSGAGKKTSKKR